MAASRAARTPRRHRIIRRRGQRIAWTNTSRIPDAAVVAAIKFIADDTSLDRTVVHFKTAGKYRGSAGRAYSRIPDIANLEGLAWHEWRYLIVVASRSDAAMSADDVDTLAHEAKHVEQFRSGTFRQAKRSRQAEAQARAYGAWAAARWPA